MLKTLADIKSIRGKQTSERGERWQQHDISRRVARSGTAKVLYETASPILLIALFLTLFTFLLRLFFFLFFLVLLFLSRPPFIPT